MCRLRNIALESVTDGQTDRRTDGQTDGQTDDGQSDPYVSLCFAGDTKKIYQLSILTNLSKMSTRQIYRESGHCQLKSLSRRMI